MAAKGAKSIGLDIGSHAIKVVEVKARGNGFQILNFGYCPIPPGAQENDQQISELIRGLFQKQRIKGKQVYLAASGPSVAIRRTTLPKMPAAELPEAIKWDARDEVLFPMEEASVDYFVTRETVDAGNPMLEMVTVIAEGQYIRRRIDLVKNAGLHLLGINAFPLALVEYGKTVSPEGGGEVTGYIDMGAVRTRVYFECDGDLLFFREIPTGGHNVTEALMEPFDLPSGARVVLDEMRAEEIKKEHGLPEEDAPGTTSEGIPLDELYDRLLPVLNKQAEELYRSVEYFKNLFKREDISRLTVSGGAGGLKGFYRFLSSMLELRIEQFNPLAQSSPPVAGVTEEETQILGPSLTAATGLGIGACGRINLLPEEFRPSIKKDLIRLARVAVVPLILSGLVLYSGGMRDQVKERQRSLQAVQQEMNQLTASLQQMQAPKQELAQLEVRKSDLSRKIGEMPLGSERGIDYSRLFDEMVRQLPENASLEHLILTPGSGGGSEDDEDSEKNLLLRIEGQVFGNEVQRLGSLERFIRNLEQSMLFSRVRVEETRELDGSVYSQEGLQFRLIGFPVERGREVPL
ncbi:MAG: type IV pilus assembly protein PilM [Nitrospina sp.]|nr:type IV pilus assembly protein PilM [Nitrospina sp.]